MTEVRTDEEQEQEEEEEEEKGEKRKEADLLESRVSLSLNVATLRSGTIGFRKC